MYLNYGNYKCDGCGVKIDTDKDDWIGLSTNAKYRNILSTPYRINRYRNYAETFHYCKNCYEKLGYRYQNNMLCRKIHINLIDQLPKSDLRKLLFEYMDWTDQNEPPEKAIVYLKTVIDSLNEAIDRHLIQAEKVNKRYLALRKFLDSTSFQGSKLLKEFDKQQRRIRAFIRRNK